MSQAVLELTDRLSTTMQVPEEDGCRSQNCCSICFAKPPSVPSDASGYSQYDPVVIKYASCQFALEKNSFEK